MRKSEIFFFYTECDHKCLVHIQGLKNTQDESLMSYAAQVIIVIYFACILYIQLINDWYELNMTQCLCLYVVP